MEAKVLDETFTKEERKSINSLQNINMGFGLGVFKFVLPHYSNYLKISIY